jgi:hypothetical protein
MLCYRVNSTGHNRTTVSDFLILYGPECHAGVTIGLVTKRLTVKNMGAKAASFALSHVPTLAHTFPGPLVSDTAVCNQI